MHGRTDEDIMFTVLYDSPFVYHYIGCSAEACELSAGTGECLEEYSSVSHPYLFPPHL